MSPTASRTLTVADGRLVRDGQPHRVLSGALHYFRVHPDLWRHRLQSLQAMGLNCVETYVPWNLHEPHPGEFVFEGLGDLEGFLDLAAELGLDAIVRPGPYICAEWDAGGLPVWLLAEQSVPLRCADPGWLAAVERWFDELIPRIAARQSTRGGNVVMVQVENEYGSYGDDRAYLERVRDMVVERGIEVPLFTSDGPTDFMLTGGSVDGALSTVNFGSRAVEAFDTQRRHRPDDPLFCMEFWCGWFTHWGHPVDARPADEVAAELASLLEAGGSVNIYMAHGGTNFAGWSGANLDGPHQDQHYRPTVTSYDYLAPIDELGRPTDLFRAMQRVLAPYHDGPLPELPPAPPVLDDQDLRVDASAPLGPVFDAQPEITVPVAPSFDELGIQYGLARYRTQIPGPRAAKPLILPELADLARISVDGDPIGLVERDATEFPDLEVTGESAEVELVVEAMGRVNYGPRMRDLKGLGPVRHERQYVFGFTAAAVDLTSLPDLEWGEPVTGTEAHFHRVRFHVDRPGDSLLVLPGWQRGHLWVNGFALGRYWDRGPQDSYYLPGPLLHPGDNEIVLLEMGSGSGPVQLRAGARD